MLHLRVVGIDLLTNAFQDINYIASHGQEMRQRLFGYVNSIRRSTTNGDRGYSLH
jgi:hypothetical protein